MNNQSHELDMRFSLVTETQLMLGSVLTLLTKSFGIPGAKKPMNTQITALDKVLEQIDRIEASYGVPLFPSSRYRGLFRNDMEILFRAGLLRQITPRYKDPLGVVRLSFPFPLQEGDNGRPLTARDIGNVELPLARKGQLHTGMVRIGLRNPERLADVRHLLKISWSASKQDRDETRHSFVDRGFGRDGVAAAVQAAGILRRNIEVTRTGTQGYAFAKEIGGNLEGIFLLPEMGPYSVGQRYRCVLVLARQGCQARDLELVS